jgi:enoyl-CoA hydratase/carnithine racemase
MDAVEVALGEAEGADAPRALVTVASGKFWSNGLDLDWLGANPDELEGFVDRLHKLYARFLGSSVPTVAAIQGHAFAAGAMFALVHDQIVMREDRGYFCVPEVDIPLPFTAGMMALLRARLAPRVAHEAATTGRRYGGKEALDEGIVDEAVAEDQVRAAAFDRARARTHSDPRTLGLIKQRLYAGVLGAIRAPQKL